MVIGSGPNGLAAAYALARAGRDTLLLEAATEPGGAVRSEELTLPGFVHDLCSAVYPTAAASPVFAAHAARAPRPALGLPRGRPGPPARLGRGGAGALGAATATATLAALGEQPGAYERALAPLVDAWDALRPIGLGGWPPFGAALRGARRLGPRHALAAARLAATPCTVSPGLGDVGRAVLAANGLHADLAPWQRGSAAFGLALCGLAHTVGWPSPVGGANGLRDALLGACREAGVRIRCDAPVEAIETRAGRVRGGTRSRTSGSAAARSSPRPARRELARLGQDALGERFLRRLLAFRRAAGAFKVDWALAGRCRGPPTPAAGPAPCTSAATSPRWPRRPASGAAACVPRRPFLLVGQQSLADPTRAPEGRHTLWAYSLMPHRARLGAAAPGGRRPLRGGARGGRARLPRAVLARAAHTPYDLERLNRNLVGGDVTGGANDGLQLVFRPVPGPQAVPHAGARPGARLELDAARRRRARRLRRRRGAGPDPRRPATARRGVAPLMVVDLHSDLLLDLEQRRLAGERDVFRRVHLPVFAAIGLRVQVLALFIETAYVPESRAAHGPARWSRPRCARRRSPTARCGWCAARPSWTRRWPPARVAGILSIEGAEPLGRDPGLVKVFERLGVRLIGPVWNRANAFADGVVEAAGPGLTALGERLLAEMEELGIALDLSHLSPRGCERALERFGGTVLASHSNSASVWRQRPQRPGRAARRRSAGATGCAG